MAEQDYLISFVIPMRNRAKTICYCLDSILCQAHLFPIEVIVIDDASTDESCSLVKTIIGDNHKRLTESTLAKELPCTVSVFTTLDSVSEFMIRSRIRLIPLQCHQGAATARNKGIEESAGRYIWFVDSDDFIAKGALEILFPVLTAEKYDIIRFSTQKFSNVPQSYEIPNESGGVLDMNSQSIEDLKFLLNSGTVWSRVFKRAFIGCQRFNTEYSYSEDSEFTWRATLKSHSMAYMQETLYGYMFNTDSLTSVKPFERFVCYVKVVEEYLSAIQESDISLNNKQALFEECEKRLYFHAFYTYSYREITDRMWRMWYEVYYCVMVKNKFRNAIRRAISCVLWKVHSNRLFILIFNVMRKGIPTLII